MSFVFIRWVSDSSVLGDGDYSNWYQGDLEGRQEPDGGTEENCVIAQVL